MITNKQILTALKGNLKALLTKELTFKDSELEAFYRRTEEYAEKQFTGSPRERKFRLRLSAMGRSLLLLQCEKLGLDKDPRDEPFLLLKFVFGDMIEALVITLLESAGIKIDSEQEAVKLKVTDDITIPGTLDLVIDGRVYDVKTASPYSFEKFKKGLGAIEAQDSFGYCAQLAAYARAGGYEVGGWIVVQKVTGEITVVDASEMDVDHYIDSITSKAQIITHTHSLDDICADIPHYTCEDTNRQYLDKNFYFFDYKEALGWKSRLQWFYKEKNWYINDKVK